MTSADAQHPARRVADVVGPAVRRFAALGAASHTPKPTAALARGDIDAYVGAEPGPGISLATGAGKIVEYPYSTPIGSLNMVLSTRRELIQKDPALIRSLLQVHRKASEYAMGHRDAFVAMATQRLGQHKPSIEKAAPNVELTWDIDAPFLQRARYYGTQMLARKQIRQLPDYSAFIDPSFVKAIAGP